mmetsp:Transcript_20608/g.30704  ORF Transcript_20608/g.30704 Transcript_20608/m.30704 type:complete len:200 (-) Transcript_20608:402-1001(-)|eukprot:CAMPEP_0194749228 /NCGR_PEP_ID=MMETSP0323_2-20130528/3428_1 /TAXON_ID=2866 ORGANISM="Crypthecodinium cohnii, Strain Seligo" /NCGR_SAMPLE_ID=MMETSP0323_2 /ASSEMBLY_ACC=CAM_ASM_000346 /LENGTH=199 /DNA_ID=CAMNT_0039664175 /DNA_START=119 /DNA_END=718 /DNA_ORIENTATION=+
MFPQLASWMRRVFDFLGLFPRNAKICFLGLDNAGKTTLLQMLKEDRMASIKPTLYPQVEELMIGNIRFRTVDLGGHETARRIWRGYYCSMNGIVFIIDAADRTRFAEAREELHRLLEDPDVQDIPIAILGNKIDIPVAASEDEFRHAMDLPYHRTCGKDTIVKPGKESRQVEVFMCSIAKRMGFREAFDWLSQRCTCAQ